MDIQVGALVGAMAAIVGAAVGYGKLWRNVDTSVGMLKDISAKLEDCVTHSECERTHDEYNRVRDMHDRSINGLLNFARWWLAANGKSPDEIRRILNNENG